MRFKSCSILAAAGLFTFAASVQADLTYSLRFTDGSTFMGTPLELTPITVNIWAKVTGGVGNANPEGLQNGMIAFKSVIINGTPTGSITSASHATGWNGSGAQIGTASNLSADTIGDWGNASNNTIPAGISSFYRFRTTKNINNQIDWGDSDSPPGSTFFTNVDGGREFHVGSFVFTPTFIPAGSIFQFVPVTPLGGTTSPAGWYEDTTDKSALTPVGSRYGNGGVFGPGTPNASGFGAVTIGVPEPISLSFIGIAGIGLLMRNRRSA